MFNLRILVRGEDEADRQLRQFELLVSDLRPFWPMVVPLFIGWMREQFQTEGAFGGRPWERLSPEYSLFKERVRPGKGILQFDGDLRRAASQPLRSATPTVLTLTIDDPKAEFHQEGTDRMPARPLVFGSPLPMRAELELAHAADTYVGDFLHRL
jgi:hypothetical protein